MMARRLAPRSAALLQQTVATHALNSGLKTHHTAAELSPPPLADQVMASPGSTLTAMWAGGVGYSTQMTDKVLNGLSMALPCWPASCRPPGAPTFLAITNSQHTWFQTTARLKTAAAA